MFQSPETVFIVWSEEGLEKEDSSNVEEPNLLTSVNYSMYTTNLL